MKKLNLQLGSIKEMLTKEQMKKVSGGYDGGGCPTGEIFVSGVGWCPTSSCSEAQSAYQNHITATCGSSGPGTVTGYCCASCSIPC